VLPRRRVLPAVVSALLVPVLVSVSTPAAVADGTGPGPDPAPSVTQVVAISLDGLNPDALTRLGRKGTPVLHRLMRQGASTLNARTAYEMTVTLPNHTSMVTGRRIAVADGGHGVTWNDERLSPSTVQEAAGEPVASVFTALHDAGLQTGLFASKTKFSLWQRSWPESIDRYVTRLDNRVLTNSVRRDIRTTDRALTFVHLSDTDLVGHERGWMTPSYLRAVRRADRYVGRILRAIAKAGEADRTLVVVTADHGGKGTDHSDPAALADYRIPFLVRGPDVPRGVDLYSLNTDHYADPGTGRPTYDAALQPIRNGAVANLVTDVLGLPAVADSQVDALQDLDVFATP
jgi:predicted AlkP superfamily pyrophosphatase or phosphodiesterase